MSLQSWSFSPQGCWSCCCLRESERTSSLSLVRLSVNCGWRHLRTRTGCLADFQSLAWNSLLPCSNPQTWCCVPSWLETYERVTQSDGLTLSLRTCKTWSYSDAQLFLIFSSKSSWSDFWCGCQSSLEWALRFLTICSPASYGREWWECLRVQSICFWRYRDWDDCAIWKFERVSLPFSALFSDTAWKGVSYRTPIGSSALMNHFNQNSIFFLCPRPLDHCRIEDLLPAMQALYISPTIEVGSYSLPVLRLFIRQIVLTPN